MTPPVLLTGASGYVGGRLLLELQRRRVAVRCLARDPGVLRSRVTPTTAIVKGDLLDAGSLDAALHGIHTAYYLVHSMGSGSDYEDLDRQAAINFGLAAGRAGVRRIIYLGGLAERSADLSRHLRSRLETGERLRESGVPVTEFRASVVLGSGSLSFEVIRALVDRLPVMLCPSWVRTKAQPIGIDDLLAYLTAVLDLPDDGEPRVFEIGGADTASYGDLMREYARQRGLRRIMIPLPLLTPWLSSLWLGLVTPVYARVGRELIGGVRNPSIVHDRTALRTFAITPVGIAEAMARAIGSGRPTVETFWSDARSSTRRFEYASRLPAAKPLRDSRETRVSVSREAAFAPIRRIGGRRGWYFGDSLWMVRGWLDLLAGGAGMRRGRRDADSLRVGDALDFWRVEAFEPGFLRLSAEMRVPGRAWLEFEVVPDAGGARIRQTAIFEPCGLMGRLYWFALTPVHAVMFRGMLRRIARLASIEAASGQPVPEPGVPATGRP